VCILQEKTCFSVNLISIYIIFIYHSCNTYHRMLFHLRDRTNAKIKHFSTLPHSSIFHQEHIHYFLPISIDRSNEREWGLMEKAIGEWICGLRASANDALRQYEPIILVIFPFVASLLILVVGRLIHLFLQLAQDNGFKGAFLIILMNNS
jgi:hypothetical protein